jgi:hypothetical protein
MRILDFFRKKSKQVEVVESPPQHLVIPNHYYTINRKDYAIEKSIIFQSQSSAEDVRPYGYTLEVRWRDNKNDDWCGWLTYWNYKIYSSIHVANESAHKCYLSSSKQEFEWRVRPLYVMDQMEYRNFKIDKLLKEEEQEPKKHEIKGWKVKEDVEVEYSNGRKFKYKKGTLFIQLENGNIIRVNGTSEPTFHGDSYQLKNNLIPNNQVEEVEIKDEKWAHPHLLKELKTKFKLK